MTARLRTLYVVSMLTVMAGATISPALPAMSAHFSGVPDVRFWTRMALTTPALFTALAAPAAGALIDRLGRKPLLVGALVLYAAAGGLPLAPVGLVTLLVSRALLGVAVGTLMTAATTLITDYLPAGQRSRALGRQGAYMAFGGVVFLLAGGLLADLSWRAPFALYLASLLLLVPVVRLLPEPDAADRDGDDAPLPWRPLSLVLLLSFLAMAAFYVVPVQLPFHLEGLGTASGTLIGVAIASSTLSSAVTSSLYGRLRSHLGLGAALTLGFGAMAAGFGAVTLAPAYGWVTAALPLVGFSTGVLFPTMTNWAGDLAPPRRRGAVLGAVTTCFFLGQFAVPLLTQPLVDAAGTAATFGVAAGVAGAAALGSAAALVRRHRRASA